MRPAAKALKDETGLALVTVLVITAVIVTLVTGFIYRVHILSARAEDLGYSARAGVLAADGVSMAMAALVELRKKEPNLVIDEGGLVFSRPVDGGAVEVRVVDERGKLSTRVVHPATGLPDAKTEEPMRRLLASLKLDEGLADALADWQDRDSAPRPAGAEEAWYSGLAPPYEPRNAPVETVEELHLVKGFSPEAVRKIAPYVTPYSADGAVNINTAPKAVLGALTEGMSPGLADELIRARKSKPFRDRSDVMKVPGFRTIGFGLQDRVTVASDTYRVYSRAIVGEVVREAEAVITTGGAVLYWREM